MTNYKTRLADQDWRERNRGQLNSHILLYRYRKLVTTTDYLLKQLNEEEGKMGASDIMMLSNWTTVKITSPHHKQDR